MQNAWHSLVQRVPETYTGLREDIATAFGIVEGFDGKAKAINGDATLSETGRRQRLQQEAAKPREHLSQLKTKAQASIASIAARKKALQPVVKDHTDPVAEMRRAELRTFLRGMSTAERNRLLFSGDRDIIEAVVDAPAALSGIDEEMRAKAVEHFMEATSGPALRDLEANEDALEAAEAALEVAGRALEKLAETEGKAA
jgi:hypothetical protein